MYLLFLHSSTTHSSNPRLIVLVALPLSRYDSTPVCYSHLHPEYKGFSVILQASLCADCMYELCEVDSEEGGWWKCVCG